MRRALAGALALAALLGAPAAAAAQETHLVLVVGLAGQSRYGERFHEWASSIREAAVGRLGLREGNVVWLGEDAEAAPGLVRGRATVASVRAALDEIAGRAGTDDRVVVVLIGHGTDRGGDPRFNLSGPDLGPAELDLMLRPLAPRRVAVIHTGSASGDFVPGLSGAGRTIITATRSGREANETWFGEHFAAALGDEGADLDKDGRVSLLEAFEYARRGVARYFEENQLLATEHALLDDDGDGQGSMEPGPDGPDGPLAGTFYLGASAATVAAEAAAADDPELRRLLAERTALEERVAALRARREGLDPAVYERDLEALLVELALKNREIRAREGG